MAKKTYEQLKYENAKYENIEHNVGAFFGGCAVIVFIGIFLLLMLVH